MKFSFLKPALLAAFALTLAVAARAQTADTGELPAAPSPMNGSLTGETNAAYARAVLRNHRPYNGADGSPDDAYRVLRDEYKLPLTITWDQSYADNRAKVGQLMWDFIERGVCSTIRNAYNPQWEGTQYFQAKAKKIKRVHFTTTDQPITQIQRDRYAGVPGYVMSWNPATGTITIALNNKRLDSTTVFNPENLLAFINDNIK